MAEFQKESFDEFFLSDKMLNALGDINYVTPTPVQSTAIPLVMAGIDLIVQSQTGTGKTAAFAIPVIEMLDPSPGVDVLTLAPTRELAKQVAAEFETLGRYKDLGVATVYGGASYEKQYRELENAQIVCATPGRLLDILKRGKLDLSKLKILCLDEADEMLSMGFAEELDAILEFLPEERQSLLFSATITEEVKALAGSMLYYPEFLTHSEDSVAAEDVEHHYFTVRGVGRARDLLKVLEYEEPETAIIFANTRDDTFMVTRFLKRHGRRAEVLNGDLPQKERERTLAALRDGEIDFLVATDVAARGIDISDLSHVFNYTLPDNAEVYIHRTGRTGRAGQSGRAVSLVSPREMGVLFNIKKMYQFPLVTHELPTPHEILEAKKARRLSNLGEALEGIQDLSYGGKLGVAESLLDSTSSSERIRLVAKLLTLAEDVIAAKIQGTPVPVAKPAAQPAPKPAPAPQPAPEPSSSTTSSDKPAAEARKAEAHQAQEEQPQPESTKPARRPDSGRRRSKPSKKDEAEPRQPTPKAEEPSSSGAEAEATPRRRRRRRSKSDENTSTTETASESPKSSSPRKSSDRSTNGSRSRSRNRSTPAPVQSEPESRSKASIAFTTSKLWVNMGRNHFDSNDDIVEMVCYMAGMEPEDLGEVSIESSYSYVEVREDYFYDIINAINNQEWKGVRVAAEPARK